VFWLLIYSTAFYKLMGTYAQYINISLIALFFITFGNSAIIGNTQFGLIFSNCLIGAYIIAKVTL